MSNLQAASNFAVYLGKLPLKLSGVRSPFNVTNTKLIFSFDNNGNSVSWSPSNPAFLNTLSELVPNTGYYLVLTANLTLDEFAPSFQPAIVPTAKFFVDSVNGLDSNSGTLSTAPFKTLAKLKQQTIASGTAIYLARGSYWREEFFRETSGLSIIAYGSGQKPVIDGSDIVPSNSFVVDTINPNTHKIDWTLVSSIGAGASFRVSVWENKKRLKRTYSLQECNTTDGSFFCVGQFGDGSLQTGNGTTNVTIHINATGNLSNNVYEITKRVLCIGLGDNGLVDGIHTKNHAINDGSIRLYHNAIIKNCLAEWGSKHHFYLQSGTMQNCQAWKIGDPDCIPYIAFTPDIDGADYVFQKCISVREPTDVRYSSDATQGWYAHGVAGVSPGDVTIENCEVYSHGAAYTAACSNMFVRNSYAQDCTTGVTTGTTVLSLIENNEFKNCHKGVEVYFTTSPVRIRNNKFYGDVYYTVLAGVSTPIEITNNIFDTVQPNVFGIYLLQDTPVTNKQNIYRGFTYPWLVNGQDFTKITSTKNVYFPAPIMGANGVNENFAQWQGRNIDTDSVVGDPKYAEAAPVFSLQPTSPAIPLGAGLLP